MLFPRKMAILVVSLGASVAAASVGCSSSSSSSQGGGAGNDAGSGATGNDGGSGLPAADEACTKMATNACVQCCGANHASGEQTYTTAFNSCVCQPARCATQCASTDCSTDPNAGVPQAGDPCDLCEQPLLADGGACAPVIASACGPSADCTAYQACIDQCP